MLEITVPATDLWDESNQSFIAVKEQTLELEHSLVSLSKWESKWCKPFISKTDMTWDENIDYVRCMTLTKNVDPNTYRCLTKDNMSDINRYINAPMTATSIREEKTSKSNSEQLTSELIYYYMTAFNIPFECQKWHLNRLIMLIRVCNTKNQPPKKMSQRDAMSRQASINAARRKQLGTRG